MFGQCQSRITEMKYATQPSIRFTVSCHIQILIESLHLSTMRVKRKCETDFGSKIEEKYGTFKKSQNVFYTALSPQKTNPVHSIALY